MLKITLKGGDVREVMENTTVEALCRGESPWFFSVRPVPPGSTAGSVTCAPPDRGRRAGDPLTFEDEDGRKAYWHTTSHIMAQAVQRAPVSGGSFRHWPIGGQRLYYDFDLPCNLTPEDLEKIEAEMKKIIKENLPLERFELPPQEPAP